MKFKTKDTVYYDEQCHHCRKEIAQWKKRSGASFEFIDIHALSNPERQAQMLKRLHLITPQGKLLVGLQANLRIWRSHPVGKLSYLVSLPVVYQAANWFYNKWADNRYNKLYNEYRCA